LAAKLAGGEFLRLSVHRARLQAQGVLQALEDLGLLLPWNLNTLKGQESPARLAVKQRLSEAVWSDRASRLRTRDGAFRDEWASPPPALGMLRYATFGWRRPSLVLYISSVDALQVSGKLRRADSLAPVPAAALAIEFANLSATAYSNDDGSFTWTRDSEAKNAALKIFCKDSSGTVLDSIWVPVLSE
jgi:hypothetical protein